MGFEASDRVIELNVRVEAFWYTASSTPNMCQAVADRAMQIFGGAGVCQDTMIPTAFTMARFCRIADGPDEVHMSQLAKLTIRSLVN
jgi:alkylation response protein AidB-like acyl-CoA dehydrogenase